MTEREKRLAAAGLVVLIGLLMSCALLELICRMSLLKPRVQIVRNNLTTLYGVPIWVQTETLGFKNEGCPAERGPGTTNIAFFGNSIFSVGMASPEQVFSSRLQNRLDSLSRSPGFCAMNFSQPGFHFDGKFALARRYLPLYKPRIVYWEIWHGEPWHYVLLGRSAYFFHGLKVGEDGYPAAFHLPAGLNRWLFTHSRFYEFATLALLPQGSMGDVSYWENYVQKDLARALDLARQNKSEFVLVFCPRLDREFSESIRHVDLHYESVIRFAKEKGIRYMRLEEELVGRDFRSLRNDPCCHYNSEGHQALADVFYRKTMELLKVSPLGRGGERARQGSQPL